MISTCALKKLTRPFQPSERERIEQAGGFVEYYGVHRVQGVLAVSRLVYF